VVFSERRAFFRRYTKDRKRRPLVPFSNFRFFKGLTKIREWHHRSFLMTCGIKVRPVSKAGHERSSLRMACVRKPAKSARTKPALRKEARSRTRKSGVRGRVATKGQDVAMAPHGAASKVVNRSAARAKPIARSATRAANASRSVMAPTRKTAEAARGKPLPRGAPAHGKPGNPAAEEAKPALGAKIMPLDAARLVPRAVHSRDFR